MLREYPITQAVLSNANGGANGGGLKCGAGRAEGRGLAGGRSGVQEPKGGDAAAMVLLVSPDPVLILDLSRIFKGLGLVAQVAIDLETGLDAMEGFGAGIACGAVGSCVPNPGVVLLDARLPGVRSGRLLAGIQGSGLHGRCAVALIAEQVSDEWIARLREGVIDDIVPRSADIATWRTHISTMQRGHMLSAELKQLREMALLELEHDRETGTFNHDAMMLILFRETDRVQRLHGALSVVLLGVENLDMWPEKLGNSARGELLRGAAGRMAQLLRSYDVLGRMSENTFLLVLPGCSAVNATLLAERMLSDVFGEPFVIQRDGAGTKRAGGSGLGVEEVTLTARFAVATSRGRSPVVVMREVEQALEKVRLAGDAGREGGAGVEVGCGAGCGYRDDGIEGNLGLLYPAGMGELDEVQEHEGEVDRVLEA